LGLWKKVKLRAAHKTRQGSTMRAPICAANVATLQTRAGLVHAKSPSRRRFLVNFFTLLRLGGNFPTQNGSASLAQGSLNLAFVNAAWPMGLEKIARKDSARLEQEFGGSLETTLPVRQRAPAEFY